MLISAGSLLLLRRLVLVVFLRLRLVRLALRWRRNRPLCRWTSLLPLTRRRILRRTRSWLIPRWRRGFVPLRRTIHLGPILWRGSWLWTIRLRLRLRTVVRRHTARMIVACRWFRRAIHVRTIVRGRLIRLRPIRLRRRRTLVARRWFEPTIVVRPIVGSRLSWSRLVRLRAIARIGLVRLGPVGLRLVRLWSVVVRLI